jgi:signal transduction histidine kinase
VNALPDRFAASQASILEQVARGAPLERTLEDIVHLIEAQASAMRCSIVLLDKEAGVLTCIVAPTLPPPYSQSLIGLKIGPHAGSCGAAAYLGERVIVSDIATHPNWIPYRHLALPFGLRACWSTPIFGAEREVIGTFAMYYEEITEPREHEIGWVAVATHLASIAILRDRSERALKHSEARARRLALLFSISSAVNEAIVRLREPLAIYDFACRVAVERKLAALAWIGLYPARHAHIERVVRYGEGAEYVDSIDLDMADERMCKGPAGRALHSGEPSISHDIAADPGFYWKEQARRYGLRSCAVFPLKSDGKPFGVLVLYATETHYFGTEDIQVLTTLAADISFAVDLASAQLERQRLALQLERSQRLHSLGTLAGGIAHDFNNILGTIIGNAGLAHMKLPAKSLAAGYIAKIQKAAQHGSELVRQLLTFDQREGPSRENINPREVVEEGLQLLRPLIPAEIVLKTRFEEPLPTLLADSTQLQQVITNLGTNALHAIGNCAGTIEVSLESCVVDAAGAEQHPDLNVGIYIKLRISDSGCGMDAATLRHAFDPFFTTKGPDKGTGLGLSVVHGIVMGHGGAIDLRSQVGEGTTFTLYFPATAGTESSPPLLERNQPEKER